MDEFVPNGENTAIGTFIKPVSKDFSPCFGGESRVIFEGICLCNEFESFIIVLVTILESKINFLVRKFLEVFLTFFIPLLLSWKTLRRDSLEVLDFSIEKGFLGSFRF